MCEQSYIIQGGPKNGYPILAVVLVLLGNVVTQ